MEKRSTKAADKDKPTWDWMQVQCSLKINQSNKKSAIWNLTPTIILTNPTSEYSDPNVRLYIDTQKSLQYSPELGWNWHKSWNLPNISIRLEIKDQNTSEPLLAPKNLYAQMFAVKRNSDSDRNEHLTLVDVGIRGDSKMQMIDGQVYFSAMKFSSTTYNNQGMNFNLLIVLYINEDGNEKPKILTAVMSPGIFVDSRRSARDYQQKKFNSFIEPFLYENLQKEYIKRENKSKTQSQIVIKNDPQGFYNYLTAPNIRHKVKHPIFLAIKFSNCVQILYNNEQLEKMNTKSLIQNLQKKLLKQNKSKVKNQNGFLGSPNQKTFIFLVQNMHDSLKKKKVMESIQTMENSAIGVLYDRKQLNNSFQTIGDPESLIKAYRQSYQNLLQQCKRYQPSDSQQQSSDQEEQVPSQRSVKKVKLDDQKAHTRGNNVVTTKKADQPYSHNPVYLKREYEEQHQVDQAQFFPPTLNQFGSKKGSAFNRAVGFKTINPENSEKQTNKGEALRFPPQQANNAIRMPQNNISIQQSNMNMTPQAQNKNLQSMMCNNLMLTSYLNTLKNNSVNMYDTLTGGNMAEQVVNQPSIDRYNSRNDQRGMQNNYQTNQQLNCLLQQINLYKELFLQVSYQNALLGGRSFPQNNQAANPQQAQMNYPPQMLHNMLNSMAGLQGLGGLGGMGLSQMQGLQNLAGLGGMNFNPSNPNNNQGLNSSGLSNQGFPPQGMNLGGMPLNLQTLQSLQALQGLNGLMNPNGIGNIQNTTQIPNNMNLNDIMRNSFQKSKQQQKRGGRQQKK